MRKLLLVLISLIWAGGFVAAQEPHEAFFDLESAGLATRIDRTNADDEGSLTVEWVYADPLRLTVSYWLDSTFVLADSPSLTTVDGAEFTEHANRSVLDSKTHNLIIDYYPMAAMTDPKSGQRIIVDNYFSQLDLLPPTLDLTFSVRAQLSGERLRSYSVPFSVPLHPAVTVAGEHRTRFQNVTLWVDQVIATPSQTQFELCYTLPDAQHLWELSPTVLLPKIVGFMSSSQSTTDMTDPTKRCDRYNYDLIWDGQPVQLTIAVGQLVGSSLDPADAGKVQPTIQGPWDIFIPLPANQPSRQF